MRNVFLAGLMLLSGTNLYSVDTVGSNKSHLGKNHLSPAGASVSFSTPLAHAFAFQMMAPVSESVDASMIASVGEPCRRLHPNKEFESFAHIRFDGKRDDSIAREQSVLAHSDEAIADASDALLLDNGVLDSHPVTNSDYEAFTKETGHATPPHWNGGQVPQGLEGAPVTHVSYDDAQSFAKWSEKRLPTSNEWMSASDQLSWDLEMPRNEWTAAPNDQERAMVLNRRNGSFEDLERSERNANTTFRLVSPSPK